MAFTSKAYLQWLKDTSPHAYAQLLSTHLSLGYHPKTHDELLVPDIDRYSGTYVIGLPGMGKSAFLEGLIHQDAKAGKAIILLDPHSDLADHSLEALPKERLAHTYVLDMLDEKFPFGVNLFATLMPWAEMNAADRTALVARTTHVIEVLFGEAVLKQAHLPRYLTNATILLLSNPGTTLYDMMRLFRDTTYRQRLLANVDDFDVKEFWRYEFEELGEAKRKSVTDPLMGRLQQIFVGHPITRNILGQRKTTINFRKAIERHEIILIKLPIKKLKQDAELIGIVLVAQIHEALFSFANVPDDQRPGFSFYIDEFQNFVTKDIEEIFTEGRKFGSRLTIAHQKRDQVPSSLQSATLTARTKIAFQLIHDDAREMAHAFPDDSTTINPEDIEPAICAHWLKFGSDNPYVRTLIEEYLKPLQLYRSGKQVELEVNPDIGDMMKYGAVNVLGQKKKLFVPEPTLYLNNLFYEVMRTQNPNLVIPEEAVLGFANCHINFFGARSGAAPAFRPGFHFGPPLVINRGNGPAWTRPPDTGREQLLHLLFHLRMTMHHLAEHPVGKETQATTADVAGMLVRLGKRTAFVRSGDEVGVIYTHATPARVMGPKAQERTATVRQQTREAYCQPLSEVVKGFVPTTSLSAQNQAAVQDEVEDEEDDGGATLVVPRVKPTAPSSQGQEVEVDLSRWEEV